MSELATLIPLDPHPDHRGSFTEVFRTHWAFDVLEDQDSLVQASVCVSKRGVLRGMHRHRLHGDFWTLVSGRIQVGLCRDGKRESFILEPDSALYIPNKTWHGFLALEDTTLLYLQDSYYDPTDEAVARWDSCGIEWTTISQDAYWNAEKDRYDFVDVSLKPILSDRDCNAPTLEEVECASR